MDHPWSTRYDLALNPGQYPITDFADVPVRLTSHRCQLLQRQLLDPQQVLDDLLIGLQFHNLPAEIILCEQVVHFKRAVGEIIQEIAPADLPVGRIVQPSRQDRLVRQDSILDRRFFPKDFIPTCLPLPALVAPVILGSYTKIFLSSTCRHFDPAGQADYIRPAPLDAQRPHSHHHRNSVLPSLWSPFFKTVPNFGFVCPNDEGIFFPSHQ